MSVESVMALISQLYVCGALPVAAYDMLIMGLEYYRIVQKNAEAA